MRDTPLSVRDLLSWLESLLQVEESVSRTGGLYRIDPSIRNFSLVSITVSSLFTHSILALLMMCLLLMGLVFLSKIPLRSYFVKTLVIPLFSLLIVAPVLFIVPGDPIWSASVGPFTLAVSQEGARSESESSC